MENKVLDKIQLADMVLVGLGEEFDTYAGLHCGKEFKQLEQRVKKSQDFWMLPALRSLESNEINQIIYRGLKKLSGLLQDKNYFVISVSTNNIIEDVPWKKGRLVMPCGSLSKKQCEKGCDGVLEDTSSHDRKALEEFFRMMRSQKEAEDDKLEWKSDLGICSRCGAPLVLNNIYTEKYNENGYLEQWNIYKKWLQGTLNKNLLILELGVGMQFPSVIRWPFEKIAFFQQKSEFYRINERLSQMSEELKGKGISIAENSIDWLDFL